MEYDVDVDANTGRVVKFEVERCCRGFDDRYDRYDRDYDDYYDDRYDFDDWYDFD